MGILLSLINLTKNYFNQRNNEAEEDLLFLNSKELENAQKQLETIARYNCGIDYAIKTEQYEAAKILEDKIKDIGLPTITI